MIGQKELMEARKRARQKTQSSVVTGDIVEATKTEEVEEKEKTDYGEQSQETI